MYRNLALYALVERDECLRRNHSRNHLHLVVEQVHELFVVAGIYLEQHGVGTGGEVAFHYLRDGEQLLHHILVHASAFEVDADVCAGGVAHALGIDIESAAGNHAASDEMLYTLMDGSTRHTAFGRHIFEWDTGVLLENAQYLLVEIVNFFQFISYVLVFPSLEITVSKFR